MSGTLGDGTAFACSAAVTAGGILPIWFVPRGELPGSYVAGFLTFGNAALTGYLEWFDEPRKSKALYSDGFTSELNVVGISLRQRFQEGTLRRGRKKTACISGI